MKRREFMKAVAAGSAAPVASTFSQSDAQAATPLKIAIIGGGMSGATTAKYLRYWGAKLNVPVTVYLIEKMATYTSNILSNEVLVGIRQLSSLTFKYDTLKSTKYGVNVITKEVGRIDPVNNAIYDKFGTLILDRCDKIILAAGLQFDYSSITISPAGSKPELLFPHAWQAGAQTTTLQSQLNSLQTTPGTFLISIPPKPYRCPPGPYERACVVADWMKSHSAGSKVIVLDANPGIQAEPVNFGNAFAGIHKNYITYVPNTKVTGVTVSSSTKTIATSIYNGTAWVPGPNYTAAVVNIIPPMKAPDIVLNTLGPNGLNSDPNPEKSGRWALINEMTYQSKIYPNIYVIGDSISSIQPKAGHIGNEEGKICADAIIRGALGVSAYPSPVTNSACFTPITTSAGPSGATATFLTALYRYDNNIPGMALASGAAPYESSGSPTSGKYNAMNKWFASLMQDVFS
jgi:NADPH-dependent 2,4-dienoyl-CoA reductase/sulfur reductase-like enzyme